MKRNCGFLSIALALAVAGAQVVTFDVVSIKPAPASQLETYWAPEQGGRFLARGATAKQLIAVAYGVRESQVVGGPNWLHRDRWNIEAKTEGFAGRFNRQQLLQAMKCMLADRFELRTHLATRRMPVYALVVSKNGPKLKAATERSPFMSSGRGLVEGKSVTMDLLARTLSLVLERPVVNQTGLTGQYEVRLEWAPDPVLGGAPSEESSTARDDNTALGSIFTMIQTTLGLRLQARSGPAEVIEIVEVRRPSEN